MPLDVPEGQKFLSELLDTYQPNVVIIDSLQKIASKELTDEQAVKNLIHFLSVVRDKYGCAVVVVHHHRKKSNDAQKRDGVELSDVYGSTYAVTDVDWVLSLRKKTADVLTVDMLKNRLGPEKDAFDVTRDSNLGFDIDGMNASRQFKQGSGVNG
jgi:RecA-family ATPase